MQECSPFFIQKQTFYSFISFKSSSCSVLNSIRLRMQGFIFLLTITSSFASPILAFPTLPSSFSLTKSTVSMVPSQMNLAFPNTSQTYIKNSIVIPSFDTSAFGFQIALILLLVLAGGLFAGLTLGLLSLDLTALDVLEQSGDPAERKYANLIKPIRKKGHWLLVTLLLSNVIVNESLPILTDNIWGGGWPAIIISTTLIVIFGEIIPQAVCSRYGLAIGSHFRWVVKFLMLLLSPIAYPISKLLDWLLGTTEGFTYKRAELKALVALHEKSEAHLGPLTSDEVKIIKGVLELRDKNVKSMMTPLEDLYMLSTEQVLDESKILEIVAKGHSRIPVYHGTEPKDIRGMLLVKKLVSYDPHLGLKVKEFSHAIASLPIVSPKASCFDIFDLFQTGRSHMAIIAEIDALFGSTAELNKERSKPLEVVGIVTLEDIVEEMIGEEIIDETDIYVDISRKLPVPRTKPFRVSSFPGFTPSLSTPVQHSKLLRQSSESSTLPENLSDQSPLLKSSSFTSS